ncbi:Protein-N(pi)-phosphohistidine--sugar phosphotransferase [Streptococcus parauberis]|nr:Protein-N(pi)-phosphohistidine--sugar phosphotransferase [Streptococcus parauberis]
MIGGGLGGLYAGVMQVHRFATGSSGLPAVLLYIGDNTMKFFWNIIIAIIITVISTAIITYFLSLRFEEKVPSELELPAEKLVALSDTLITAPISGQVIELSQVADPVFASESLGKGFAIQPNAELVVAPFDGQVITVLPTKHAIGLLSDSGLELLIHIGLDTVNLNGQFFESYVKEGDKVAKGQKLISFEKMAIENAGYQTEIPIVVTNTANFVDFELMANGTIETMEPVLKVQI